MKFSKSSEAALILLYLQILTSALEVIINDEVVSDPALKLKSKFKKYLPELQETLEIPLRYPDQQSLKESFLQRPRPHPNPNHRGIRTRLKEDLPMLFRSRIRNSKHLMPDDNIGDGDESGSDGGAKDKKDAFDSDDGSGLGGDNDNGSGSGSGSDDESNAPFNSEFANLNDKPNDYPMGGATAPSGVTALKADVKLQSNHSFVKDFLAYRTNHFTALAIAQDKIDRDDKYRTGKKLKSKINEYQDSLNDPKDLKKWVRLIADKSNDGDGGNGNGKGNGGGGGVASRSKNFVNNEIEIDIDEFINYLVNEQGFNPKDLQFLKMRNLDYGLGEIEMELSKLREMQVRGNAKVISIGGEDGDGADGVSSSGLTLTVGWYMVMTLAVFSVMMS
ncbi:uncharacterized protein LODBEIA_P37600 [Lodderomyces beijingensis]|uniref:Uncharacterized protein n=1 Tax=Lodderomyces beijingensis TaxID=1775926 RepID=A0ABP0ZN19_9ASCO